MIGVAIQQVPWLCVLDFQQYGDLRAVVMACKQKQIVCTTLEQVHIMTQLSCGCAHIAKKRMIHMDIAVSSHCTHGHRMHPHLFALRAAPRMAPWSGRGPGVDYTATAPLCLACHCVGTPFR